MRRGKAVDAEGVGTSLRCRLDGRVAVGDGVERLVNGCDDGHPRNLLGRSLQPAGGAGTWEAAGRWRGRQAVAAAAAVVVVARAAEEKRRDAPPWRWHCRAPSAPPLARASRAAAAGPSPRQHQRRRRRWYLRPRLALAPLLRQVQAERSAESRETASRLLVVGDLRASVSEPADVVGSLARHKNRHLRAGGLTRAHT